MQELEAYLSYSEAVDLMARAHRSLKHQYTWNQMVAALLHDCDHPANRADIEIARADKSLMGVWINGATEAMGLHLLRHCVPCFIVNKVSTTKDQKRADKESILESFVQQTHVEWLASDLNQYDCLALISGMQLRMPERDIGIATSVPVYLLLDYARASPTVQVSNRQGTNANSSTANELTLGAGEELLPPAIAAPGPGSWMHWMEATLEDNHTPCFEQIGSRRVQNLDGTCYFDQLWRRYLYFNEEQSIPPNYKASPEIWGQPVGICHFVLRNQAGTLDRCEVSTRIYQSERPARNDEGREYCRGTGNLSHSHERPTTPPVTQIQARDYFNCPLKYSRRACSNYYRPAEVIFRSPPRGGDCWENICS